MRLKTWLKRNKIKVRRMANESGVSAPALSTYCNRQREPSLAQAVRINEYTNNAVTFKDMLLKPSEKIIARTGRENYAKDFANRKQSLLPEMQDD